MQRRPDLIHVDPYIVFETEHDVRTEMIENEFTGEPTKRWIAYIRMRASFDDVVIEGTTEADSDDVESLWNAEVRLAKQLTKAVRRRVPSWPLDLRKDDG